MPQHLELEDVIAWGLGATDLLWLVGGAIVSWWLYLALPDLLPLRLAVALPAFALGLAMALLRVGERPLREWVRIVSAYVVRARLLVTGRAR